MVGTNLVGDVGVEMALDLTDAAAGVVHLAGQASIGAAHAEAARTWSVNLGGRLKLALTVARHAPAALVLFASSSEVYGAAFGTDTVDEDVPPQPRNNYARSKLMAEAVLAQVLPARRG